MKLFDLVAALIFLLALGVPAAAHHSATYFDMDDEVESITVGGLVAEEVGRVPKPGDVVRFGHLQLEVLAASPRRAERLLVRRMAEPAPRVTSDRAKPESSS